MKPFGEFIMQNRRNAGILAFAFAILPLLQWLGIIIVALVTLRKGMKEGGFTLACFILPALAFVLIARYSLSIDNTVLTAIMVWILAIVLHRTHNWTSVLLVAAALGVIVVLMMHGTVSAMSLGWKQRVQTYLQDVGSDVQMSAAQQQAMVLRFTKLGTWLQIIVTVLLGNLLMLMIARCWQAFLYNPGQLRPELQKIKLPIWASVLLLAMLASTFLTQQSMLVDSLPLIFATFVLAGLSLVHFIVYTRKIHWVWLLLFYIVSLFAWPHVGTALVVIALFDSVLDLRKRYYRKQGN